MGRAIARDDLKRRAGLKLARQFMQQVEQAHVDGVNFACTMIPENVVDGGARIGRMGAILPILNGEGFACV